MVDSDRLRTQLARRGFGEEEIAHMEREELKDTTAQIEAISQQREEIQEAESQDVFAEGTTSCVTEPLDSERRAPVVKGVDIVN